jgi:uncharacterized cupin superfamily protein
LGKATVISDAAKVNLGERVLKTTTVTTGQTEASLRAWEGQGTRAGIWEVTPGTFSSSRDGYTEICQIISGRATIAEADGTTFEIGPGSFVVTTAGWEGTWTVHETLRKMWVVAEGDTE